MTWAHFFKVTRLVGTNGLTVSPLKEHTDGTGQMVDSWRWLHPHLVTEDSLTSAALSAHHVYEIYVREVSLSQVSW